MDEQVEHVVALAAHLQGRGGGKARQQQAMKKASAHSSQEWLNAGWSIAPNCPSKSPLLSF